MRQALSLAMLSLVASLAVGCGASFQLQPVAANVPPTSLLGSGHIADVQIDVSPELQEDKQAMLERNNVPAEMRRVLSGQGMGANPLTLRVEITQMRVGYGPARVHATSRVFDANGQLVREFENESMSMKGGSSTSRLQRIIQDMVQKIVEAI